LNLSKINSLRESKQIWCLYCFSPFGGYVKAIKYANSLASNIFYDLIMKKLLK